MKIKFKRLSLALIALGLSMPVLSDANSIFDASVPNQQGGFTFGGDALYMRTTAPNLGYGIAYGPYIPFGSASFANGTLADVDTNYLWGFDFMLGYRIPNSGNDATVSWTHLGDFNYSNSIYANVVIPLSGERAPDDGVFVQNGDDDFHYDAVDLDLGQRVNFGDFFNFRMFAGVRWAQLDENVTNTYGIINTTPNPDVAHITSEENDSEFKGAGPQIGFDGRYCLGYGFGIDASLTGSLLAGNTETTSNINKVDETIAVSTTSSTGTTITPISSVLTNLNNDSRDRVVPAVDANIGLDYIYAFNNCDRSYLTFDAGYRVINYFNATQGIILHTATPPASATSPVTATTSSYTLGNSSSSVTFDGPYAGVKVNL